MLTLIVVSVLVTFAFGILDRAKNVITPYGHVLSDCHHDIPSGMTLLLNRRLGGFDVFDPAHNKIVSHIPPCVHASPFATPTNNTTKGYGNTAKGYGSYDGWLAYTQAHKPAGVDNFLGFFDVPNEPAYDPTVLYLFTALQNVPWIPKVDPIPPVFDIIQPVLQYPAETGYGWSARSWYVSLDVGTIASDEISFSVGDSCFGNMTKTGAEKWFVNSVNMRTKQQTYINVQHHRLHIQPWLYTTVECYGCDGGCDYLPTNTLHFSKMTAALQHQPSVPTWAAFRTPNPVCHTTAHIASPQTVSYTFQ